MTIRFVDTSLLRIGYEVAGPSNGLPVVLLHGWPDDVRTWDALLPSLHAAGYRTYAPWLRGYGATQFLRPDTLRSGQIVALGQDAADFAKTLNLGRHALVGHDWGARAAYVASTLNEAQVCACVTLSAGYGSNSPPKLSLRQAHAYWYQWLMATPRGEKMLREDRRAFARYIWDEWFIAYKPGAAEFERTATAFDNRDWPEVVLHYYRARWGHIESDPRYAELEARFDPPPVQAVPTLTLHGARDPVNLLQSSEDRQGYFSGAYERHLIEGVGHFPQRENASQTAQHIVAWLRRCGS